MIHLDKETSLKIILEYNKINSYPNRYIFYTKFPCKCMKCLTEIFISYKQFGNNAIFCDNCKAEANTKDKRIKFIQHQYMRVVKEKQLKMIESFFAEIKI